MPVVPKSSLNDAISSLNDAICDLPQVRDLLNPTLKGTLDLREETRGPSTGVVVAGLTRANARSTHAVMEMLQRANTHRTTEPTRANATSSRSHAILQVRPAIATPERSIHSRILPETH